ncbi:hypothetical protein [Cellulomonas timonensis]|uniref:hypothetical protein n=1 Tax=Cellulomonas timonensis TaxID=1689271 RepID=UPI0008363698|nr:hypothetical protein [Cellulomonas timonensis]
MPARPARRTLPLARLGLGAAVVVGLTVTACVVGPRPAPSDAAPSATATPAALAAAGNRPAAARTPGAGDAAATAALAARRPPHAQAYVVESFVYLMCI